MDNELKKIIDNYIDSFLNQDKVKQYFTLKKAMENDKDFLKIKNDFLQSKEKYCHDGQFNKDFYQQYLDCKDKYYHHPIMENYQIVSSEIAEQLKRLSQKIKERE